MARLRRGLGGTVVLDAQGLVKLAAGDPAVRGRVYAAQERGSRIVTAASTLAEVVRSKATDHKIHWVLRDVDVVPITKDTGRKAGELLGATGLSGHRNTVDALLATVALAQLRPTLLVTSDPDDMAKLTEEPQRKKTERVAIIPV